MNFKLDFKKLFDHTKKLKQVLLVTTGRTGSDFFQSLLDSHPEILQVTGSFFFHEFWKAASCKDNLTDLIDEFVWHNHHSQHISKFKSRYNHLERWDQLGDKKDESFEIDINNFKILMLEIMKGREINSHNFFISLHVSYGLLLNQDITKTKILFYHIHHIRKIKNFMSDFKNFDVLCTIREPRNTIISGLEGHNNYYSNSQTLNVYSKITKVYSRVYQESEPISKFTNDFYTLKLEDLHNHPKNILSQFCDKYNINSLGC